MLAELRDRYDRLRSAQEAGDEELPASAPELGTLRMFAAPMLLLTGVEATLDSLARARPESAPSYAVTWAPALLAPVAAAAQVAHLARPSEAVTTAARVLNTAVVGAGIAGVANVLRAYRSRREPPSLAPLALAAAGLLGLALELQERRAVEERQRLERRAAIVERLVPQRRSRLDRIVVHV